MISIPSSRILILAGHYGSGKTNIAVNLALALKKEKEKVCILDLDIVNPYFRTKDSQKELTEAGVRLICSGFAESNVDLPSLPDEIYGVTDDKSYTYILDVGGDDRGALALGRLREGILKENDYQMLCVVNFARPLTRNTADTIEIMKEIEAASGIPFTGLINNTNLGTQTDEDYVAQSDLRVQELSAQTGLPVVFTAAEQTIAEKLFTRGIKTFPLKLQEKII